MQFWVEAELWTPSTFKYTVYPCVQILYEEAASYIFLLQTYSGLYVCIYILTTS